MRRVADGWTGRRLRRLERDGEVGGAAPDHWWARVPDLAEAGVFPAIATWLLAARAIPE
ncbi:MAG TPA: hypothetical protein VHN80_04410 [Kineosporiaceae bacterium]|nr:hypothetical protein [Kineosporiaceae bacterium]